MTNNEIIAVATVKPSNIPGRDIPGWTYTAAHGPDWLIASTYEDIFGFAAPPSHTRGNMVSAITALNGALKKAAK